MKTARTRGYETDSDESLWLELCLDGVSHTFEFGADESRAIAVGSLMRVDLRIDRPGVAPVHFHIEREADDLWIVPAYSARDLRVNAARLTGPQRIHGHAIIEFSNVRLDAHIIDRDSAVMQSSPNEDLLTAPVEQLFNDYKAAPAQPTIRMPSLFTDDVNSAPSIMAIRPHRIVSLSIDNGHEEAPATLRTGQSPVQESVTIGHAHARAATLAQDTIKMAPFWMMESEPEPEEPTDCVSSECDRLRPVPAAVSTKSHALTCATENLAPLSLQIAETTYFGPVSSRGSRTPHGMADAAAQCTTVLDMPVMRNQDAEAQNWLSRLGILSRRRPWLVWLAGTTMVFALSATLTLAGKHLQRAARRLAGHQNQPTSSAPVR